MAEETAESVPAVEPARPKDADTLASLVTERPSRARVLERFGLDYCCHGHHGIDEACAAVGADTRAVRAALAEHDAETPAAAEADWPHYGLGALAGHIVDAHHTYLRREFPRLSEWAEKVVAAHGANHPELVAVREEYEALRAELEPHLLKEERVLFPLCLALAGEDATADGIGALAGPISCMAYEHDAAGDALARLRSLTDAYTVPEDACPTYRAFYDGLAALEADVHEHIHKENNLLFPLALERSQQLLDGALEA